MIRVMLVDDHEVVRKGLRTMLDDLDDMEVVAEAASANEAVHRARGSQPDVVSMDVRLPDRSGVLACRDIRAWACWTATSRWRGERYSSCVHIGAGAYCPICCRGGLDSTGQGGNALYAKAA
jgi:DNA-binding NarL/FixJ family response regulator